MNTEASEVTKDVKKKPKQSFIAELYDYIEIFIIAACAVLLLFTFSIRLCRVDGKSMYDTLYPDQMLLVSNTFYTPQTGDIIVFHQSDNKDPRLNKPLVKRVIATGEQWYKIVYVPMFDSDTSYYSMEVYVSSDNNFEKSEKLDESYIDFKALENNRSLNANLIAVCDKDANGNYVLTGQVPQGSLFVMGDNRYNSTDSRLGVGYVDTRCVLGKVIFEFPV